MREACILLMERSKKLETWNNLIAGRSVDSLAVERRNGMVDLTGFVVPPPVPVRTTRYAIADVTQLAGVTNVRGVRWSKVDFTRASLDEVNFWSSEFSECLFEECSLRHCSFGDHQSRNRVFGTRICGGLYWHPFQTMAHETDLKMWIFLKRT